MIVKHVIIGATGQTLNDDDTNLFISRDGGSTWSMVSNEYSFLRVL